MTIERKLLGTTPVSGEVLPEAVSFDGTSDSMNRTSDLTGNSNGKTFTFSCWFYTGTSAGQYKIYQAGNSTFNVQGGSEFVVYFKNSSNTTVFQVDANPLTPINTWCHILLSVDLANTSNRYLYLNDELVNATWTKYINDNLYFSQAIHNVGSYTYDSNELIKGRLAHLFLDYTYRDLSTTSNRRLFIDADGKPSKTIPSSPILYLPMKDAATAGSNSGTGGDFTVNGVLATAERGPNQDNCSASTFDGSADYLNISSLTNAADSKLFTFSAVINRYSTANGSMAILGGMPDKWLVSMTTDGVLYIVGDSGNVMVWNSVVKYAIGSTHHIAASFDLTNTSRRYVYVDGVAVSGSYSVYNNTNFSNANIAIQVGKGETRFSPLIAGELYFDTAYIDLSADNPFWDSDTNLPNSVRKVIEDTGVTPLIALPIMGNDAGNNLGTGGDFTVNSGPYVGARGGSEFWTRTAYFNAQANTLFSRGTMTGVSSSTRYLSHVFTFKAPNGGIDNQRPITIKGNKYDLTIRSTLIEASSYGSNKIVALVKTGITPFDGNPHTIFITIDAMSLANSYLYYDNDDTGSLSKQKDVNENIDIVGNVEMFGNTGDFKGEVGIQYVTNSYINFTQEANRNKFIDQLGYPRDLTQQIEDGDIPNPLIYMKFDDTTALGTNSGTGGNFTVAGTVTAGADVKS